jgi:hypothetical protein
MANKRPRRIIPNKIENGRQVDQLFEVLHLCSSRLKAESMLPFLARLAASSKRLESVVSELS